MDKNFSNLFTSDRVNVLILVGANTKFAMDRIYKLNSKKPPFIICLNSDPKESEDDYHEDQGLNN